MLDRCFGLLDAQDLIDGVELGDHLAARHLRAQVHHQLLDAAGDLQRDRRLFFGKQLTVSRDDLGDIGDDNALNFHFQGRLLLLGRDRLIRVGTGTTGKGGQ